MAHEGGNGEGLSRLVLSDRSLEHNYAKNPPSYSPGLMEGGVSSTDGQFDLTDLLGLDVPEMSSSQGEVRGDVVAPADLLDPNNWLDDLCVQDFPLGNESTTEFSLQGQAAISQRGVGLVNDPFLGNSVNVDHLMKDLNASLSREAGYDCPELANWLEEMINDAPQQVPTQATPCHAAPASSHGSPSSDPGYDSNEGMSSPGSATSDSDRSRDTPYVPNVCFEPSKDSFFCSPVSKPTRGGSQSKMIPGITFDELERMKLSGPTAFSSASQVFWEPGGAFKLTLDELEALEAEKLPIPVSLPLTNGEEKALKSVRRKIKNKIAAQESRRKRKEYVEGLERRVHVCTNTNGQLQKRLDLLEAQNKTLMEQLSDLQQQVSHNMANPARPSARVGLLVLAICFALVIPFAPGPSNVHMPWSSVASTPLPSSDPTKMPTETKPYDYSTAQFRSRVLLHTPGLANSLEQPPLQLSPMPTSAPPFMAKIRPAPGHPSDRLSRQ